MINNLTIVSRQYDYGYDTYYVARKDESLNFPSDLSIAKSLSPMVEEYAVDSANLNVTMRVEGTLKSYTYTAYGYLSKVAKHFIVKNEESTGVVGEGGEGDYVFDHTLNNGNIVTGTLKGTIYNDDVAIQTFSSILGSTNLIIVDGENVPSVKVTAGSYSFDDVTGDGIITLTWVNEAEEEIISSVKASYSYESTDSSSVLTKKEPVADDYNFVSLYGETTLKTKRVKIISTFKCAYKNSIGEDGYTYTKSKIFYTRCKSLQSLCSSKSNAYVPAITVCIERLF